MSEYTLEYALEDVEARFLYNLPETELASPDRLFFQIEQAWWFYEDFMADKYHHLPHFKTLKTFATKIFSHCTLLSKMTAEFEQLFNDFNTYRGQIPVLGCIMLNPNMNKVVLVCSWSGRSWGFPKGKINQEEDPLECAIREVYEETGYDCTSHCNQDDFISIVQDGKVTQLYIAYNVPEDTHFQPQTRKEISRVEFIHFDDLSDITSFGIYPFIPKLKRMIAIKKKQKKATNSSSSSSSSSSKSFDSRSVNTFNMAVADGHKGWDVNAMFAANAQLTGKKYDYDGNPHSFGESHPTYTIYTNSSSSSGNGVSGDEGDMMAQLSEASRMFRLQNPSILQKKKLHNNAATVETVSSACTSTVAASSSVYSSSDGKWERKRLKSNFTLQQIMLAVDAILG